VPEGLWEILWEITEPLIPVTPKRAQGGGMARVDDRQGFAAIVFVLTTGCAWRHLPPMFSVSHQTAHRRFTEWSEAAFWAKLHWGPCSTTSAPPSTGPGRSSTARACAPNRGIAAGQTQSIAASPARRSTSCPTAQDCRSRSGLGREHARLASVRAVDPMYSQSPVSARAAAP
jgi:transposase